MRDEPARDAVRNALDRDVPYLGPEGREQRVENVLAALGIPPDTPVQDVREALNVLDALRRRSHAPEADRA